jgi:hypothetical protein
MRLRGTIANLVEVGRPIQATVCMRKGLKMYVSRTSLSIAINPAAARRWGAASAATVFCGFVVMGCLVPLQSARADSCLLDTNNSGVPDAGDTDQDATALFDPDNIACGRNSLASGTNGGANIAIGGDSNNDGFGALAGGNGEARNTAIGADAVAQGDSGTNTAVGHNAKAEGALGSNVATGFSANASGDLSRNIASGALATAFGSGSDNVATGSFAQAEGNGSNNIALGKQAVATGTDGDLDSFGSSNIAIGSTSDASGDDGQNLAAGTGARASGTGGRNVAMGAGAQATGNGTSSVAVGAQSSANFANSSAFGAGATVLRADQQVFGTSTNTHTMAGVNTDASRNAQSDPVGSLNVVTTDSSGNLAGRSAASLGLASVDQVAALQSGFNTLQSQINNLGRRDNELADGIAISVALAQPIFQPGQVFAIRGGWGNFDGSNAFGVTAAGVISKGAFGPASSVVVDGGIGTSTQEGLVAGRAGLTLGF